MDNFKTTARPYAQAIIDFCQEQNEQTVAEAKNYWQSVLYALKQIIESDFGQLVLEKYTGNLPKVKEVLLEVLPPEFKSAALDNFLEVILENNRFAYLPSIYETFITLRESSDLALKVKVISAYPLTDGKLQEIQNHIEYKLKQQVEIDTAVDPSLISGFIVEGKDFVLDCSGLTKMEQLKQAITK